MNIKLKKLSVTLATIFICLITVAVAMALGSCGGEKAKSTYYVGGSSSSASSSDSSVNGLTIPLKDFSATAKFYGVEVDGTYMEIVAVKSGNSYRTAFNTCQVCYMSKKGYFVQSGKYLVCQNCGNKYTMAQVGISASYGGCNPYPILESDRIQTDDSIVIPDSFLKSCKAIFANWTGGY